MTDTTDEAPGSEVTGQIRVFLVDDHRLFRSGVRAELDRSIPVVGEAEDGSRRGGSRDRGTLRPDVVLLDVHMPDGGGAEVLRRPRPESPVVVPGAVACRTPRKT